MIAKIEKLARDLRADYGQMADKALNKIRAATLDTADLIAKTKDPVRKLADTGLKLNRISHKGVEKLVKSHVRFVEGTIDDGTRRLELAARADSLRALFGDQIATFPQSRERAMTNARKTIDVVRDTGDEFGGVLKGTLGELQATVVAGANTARSMVVKQRAEAEAAVRNVVAETEKAIGRQAARVRRTAGEIETTSRKTATQTKRTGTLKVHEAEAEVKKATAEVKKAARKAARPAGRKKAAAKRKTSAKKGSARKSTARKASAKKTSSRKAAA